MINKYKSVHHLEIYTYQYKYYWDQADVAIYCIVFPLLDHM